MRRIERTVYMAAAAAMLVLPTLAMADTISPNTFTKTLVVGESYTLRKEVVVQAGSPTAAKVDVLFLFDTTGSMGGLIGSAKTNASAITSALSSYGSVRYGVSDYRDFPYSPFGGAAYGDYGYKNDLNVGSTAAQAQTAINGLGLGWGNDTPESQLYALQQAASTSTWRADSNRFIVWFGDAPGHTSADAGYPAGISVANAVTALNANNVKVEAINLGGATSGINTGGQAQTIASSTGGGLYGLSNTSLITSAITGSISESFNHYSNVGLGVDGAHAGVGVSISPVSYVGSWDRSTDRTFTFDVTFTGTSAGVYDFGINALVDRGITATELDYITVVDAPAVPEPSTFILLGAGLAGLGFYRRRTAKK